MREKPRELSHEDAAERERLQLLGGPKAFDYARASLREALAPLRMTNLKRLGDHLSKQQIARIQHTLRRLFVLEVSENIASLVCMSAKGLQHHLALVGGIAGLAEAVVSKICGGHVRRSQRFAFSHAEGGVALF